MDELQDRGLRKVPERQQKKAAAGHTARRFGGLFHPRKRRVLWLSM